MPHLDVVGALCPDFIQMCFSGVKPLRHLNPKPQKLNLTADGR